MYLCTFLVKHLPTSVSVVPRWVHTALSNILGIQMGENTKSTTTSYVYLKKFLSFYELYTD